MKLKDELEPKVKEGSEIVASLPELKRPGTPKLVERVIPPVVVSEPYPVDGFSVPPASGNTKPEGSAPVAGLTAARLTFAFSRACVACVLKASVSLPA